LLVIERGAGAAGTTTSTRSARLNAHFLKRRSQLGAVALALIAQRLGGLTQAPLLLQLRPGENIVADALDCPSEVSAHFNS